MKSSKSGHEDASCDQKRSFESLSRLEKLTHLDSLPWKFLPLVLIFYMLVQALSMKTLRPDKCQHITVAPWILKISSGAISSFFIQFVMELSSIINIYVSGSGWNKFSLIKIRMTIIMVCMMACSSQTLLQINVDRICIDSLGWEYFQFFNSQFTLYYR